MDSLPLILTFYALVMTSQNHSFPPNQGITGFQVNTARLASPPLL